MPPSSFPLVPLPAVTALRALGTGAAFLVQYGLVAKVGPATARMVTCVIPVIATAAGVEPLGGRLDRNTPAGALIVPAWAALAQSRPRRRPQA